MQKTLLLFGVSMLCSAGIAAPYYQEPNIQKQIHGFGNPIPKLEQKSVPAPLNTELVGSYGTKIYYTDYSIIMDQDTAKVYCTNLGMQLVSIASDGERNYLAANLKLETNYWTSGRDKGDASIMHWETSGSDITTAFYTLPPVTHGVTIYANSNTTLRVYTYPITVSNTVFPLCELPPTITTTTTPTTTTTTSASTSTVTTTKATAKTS